jgi:hypothetical protein
MLAPPPAGHHHARASASPCTSPRRRPAMTHHLVLSVSELKPTDLARTSAHELKPAAHRGNEAAVEGPNSAGERTTRPYTRRCRHLQRGRKMSERESGGGERDYRIWGRGRKRSRHTHGHGAGRAAEESRAAPRARSRRSSGLTARHLRADRTASRGRPRRSLGSAAPHLRAAAPQLGAGRAAPQSRRATSQGRPHRSSGPAARHLRVAGHQQCRLASRPPPP